MKKFKNFTIYTFSKELALFANQGLGTYFDAKKAVFFSFTLNFHFHVFFIYFLFYSWKYIKDNKLQSENDRNAIYLDEKMKIIFPNSQNPISKEDLYTLIRAQLTVHTPRPKAKSVKKTDQKST